MTDQNDPPRMTPEEEETFKKARKGRNLAIGGVLLFFAVLFYAITIVRMTD
tara:strand:+ start:363 stop:515 length:153 start_codon:yes stop_codon:yes gene_type:complete